MTKLFLIRHGQSEANVDEEIYKTVPDWQIKLTTLGMTQAVSARDNLEELLKPNSNLIYSPWYRAKSTAYLINNDKITSFEEDPIIYEQSICHSHVSMQAKEEYASKEKYQYGEFWYKVADAESYADTYLRARQFLSDLRYRKMNNEFQGDVVIVAHGVFIKLFLAALNRQTVEEALSTPLPYNCEILTADL